MFVKKDTRKIPEILDDEPEELHLGRRYATLMSVAPSTAQP